MTGSFLSTAIQQLDELCETSHLTPGLQGTIFRIVDGLQPGDTDDDHARIAEGISVALIRLQYAVRNADGERRDALLERLRELKEERSSIAEPNLLAA